MKLELCNFLLAALALAVIPPTAALAAKSVRATGALFHGLDGHHNKPVLIQAQAIPVVVK